MNKIPFQALESTKNLSSGVVRESWFITTSEGYAVRRVLYYVDGSVVAFRDFGIRQDNRLYVEAMFYQTRRRNPAWLEIEADSKAYIVESVSLFDMK